MKKFLKSIGSAVMMVLFLILGILLAAASVVWYFVPKWKREESADLDRRVENMRAKVTQAKEHRAVETKVALAEADKKAETMKAADTVDLANQFIIDEMKK